MLKKIFFLTLSSLIFVSLMAQSKKEAVITGKVQTTDQLPLPHATISLENTILYTITAEDGSFRITAPQGKYTLAVSYAGYITNTRPVTVSAGDISDIGTIVIESNSTTLREIVVSDIQKNKFGKRSTSIAARMPLSDMENPTVYNMVNKDYLQEQAAFDFSTAMNGVAGTNATNGVNESGQSITMRGFTSSAGFRNGIAVNPRTQTEIYNVERIEVLKGPSGTLFGGPLGSYAGAMATYGGVVNIVTKKPFESFRGEVAYSAGSWGLNRFTADINTPLNKEHTALARTNLLFHTQNSFQTAGFSRAFGAATSLQFKVNDKTTVKFDGEIYLPNKNLNAYIRNSDILTNPSMEQFKNIYDRSFSSNDIATKRHAYYAMAEVEHRFNDQWLSRTSYQHGESGEKESIFMVLSYVSDDSVARQIRPFDVFRITTDNIQQNFIGDFRIGGLRNRIVIGANYNTGTTENQYATFQLANGRRSVFVPFDRVGLSPEARWAPVSLGDVTKLNDNRVATDLQVNKSSSLSAYVSDALNVLDNLLIMASVRVDKYKNSNSVLSGIKQDDGYNQVQVSPKFGIVYQPVKDKITMFANYVNGFNNVPPNTNDNGEIQKFKPEQANQLEAGVKLDLLEGKLTGSISYYDIKVSDLVRFIDDYNAVQDGDLDSRGVEMELITSPVRGFNIVAGFAYNDNKYNLYDDGYKGRRAAWTPKLMGNMWASYKFLDGAIKGLGFGAGFNYVDKVYLSVQNKFYVPQNTIFNATVFYDQSKYRIGIKINNVADTKYWNFYGQPQKPRELLLNVSYKF